MTHLRLLPIIPVLALAACSGVQTGDGGDTGYGCAFSDPVPVPFDEVPEGATEAPTESFAALRAPISGRLDGPAGSHAVSVTFTMDESTLTAAWPEGDPVGDGCDWVDLHVEGTVVFDGAPFIAGTLPARVRATPGQLRAEYDADALTLKPPSHLGGSPRLAVPLQLGLDCRWTGQWRYFGTASCDGQEPCSGQTEETLGNFTAEGSCD
jgi:hypothetical protein